MERTIQSMVITAVVPWKSIYREDTAAEKHTTDTQEEIDFCLNHCPYANTECCNCLSGGKPDTRKKIDLDRLKEMQVWLDGELLTKQSGDARPEYDIEFPLPNIEGTVQHTIKVLAWVAADLDIAPAEETIILYPGASEVKAEAKNIENNTVKLSVFLIFIRGVCISA